jgi:hypothetical protein
VWSASSTSRSCRSPSAPVYQPMTRRVGTRLARTRCSACFKFSRSQTSSISRSADAGDTAQTSRDKFDRCPHATAGFTLRALDGLGALRSFARSPDAHASDPVRVPRLVRLLPASSGRRVAATPLRFATLHLHQVGGGLSPPSCRTCAAYKENPADRATRGVKSQTGVAGLAKERSGLRS